MAKIVADSTTADLLDWKVPAVAVRFDDAEVRGGDIGSRISRGVGLALKSSGMDRETIAKEMSARLGQKISRATLDAYAAEAKTEHQITLERFIALVEVTGCLDLLGLVTDAFDHVVVPRRYAAIVELHLIEEHEAELAARKTYLTSSLRRRP